MRFLKIQNSKIYLIITLLNVFIIVFSLWVNFETVQSYQQALQKAQARLDYRDQILSLHKVVAASNGPANNVFESKNSTYEKEKFDRFVLEISKYIDQIKRSENIILKDDAANHIEEKIIGIESEFENAKHEANQVFSLYQDGQINLAGGHMARMDQRYLWMNKIFFELHELISNIQGRALEGAHQKVGALKYLAWGVLLFSSLGLIAFFYHGMVMLKVTQEKTEEKEALFLELENKNEDLQKALHLNDSLNQILDRYAIISKTNLAGEITYVNDNFSEISGYSREELMGQNHRLLKSEEHPPKFYKEIWACISKGNIWHGEIKNKNKKGECYWVDSTIGPIVDGSGKAIEYLSVRFDVTDKKATEAQLIQSQKLDSIGKLAGGIAHDFNNLLSGVLGYASLLKTKLKDRPDLCSKLDVIERSALRGAELTKQMLGFARKGNYEKKLLDLNQIILSTKNIIEHSISKNISIHTKLGSEIGCVCGDSNQVSQVILNLCMNARDAMPNGGQIFIETSQVIPDTEFLKLYTQFSSKTYIKLSIKDTGVGISKAIIDKIFDPFFTTKGVGKGTGLGLSMVHGILKSHNGEVVVTSEEGRGTCFDIYFPISRNTETAVEIEPKNLANMSNLADMKILIVDDEEIIREVTSEILCENKISYEQACNGAEALHTLKTCKDISLVVMDIMMPVMDGITAYKELRKFDSEIPVLFASGYTESDEVTLLRQQGNVFFLQKPFEKSQLLEMLAQIANANQK